MEKENQGGLTGQIDLLDLTPIAVQVGTLSQVVMTATCWERRFAPNTSRHSIPQWMEMQTTAPQLEAMVVALLEAASGEDRTPCQFGFTTKSKYLAGGKTQALAVALTRFHRRRDFFVVDLNETKLADLVAEHWAHRHGGELWGRQNRVATELHQVLRKANRSLNSVGGTETAIPTAIAS